MSNIPTKTSKALGVLLITGLAFSAYWLITTTVSAAFDFFNQAAPALQTGIVAAAATITVSVVSIVLGKAYERRPFMTLHKFADLVIALRQEYGHRRMDRGDILRGCPTEKYPLEGPTAGRT